MSAIQTLAGKKKYRGKLLGKKHESKIFLPRFTVVNSLFLLAEFSEGMSGRKYKSLSRFTRVNNFFLIADIFWASEQRPNFSEEKNSFFSKCGEQRKTKFVQIE